MDCDSWTSKFDPYLDRELPEAEMRSLDVHLRSCPSCAADALGRLQMKRAIQVAGKRFAPSVGFRKQVQQRITPKPRSSFSLGWMLAAVAVIVAVGALSSFYVATWSGRNQLYSEIADLHVATLASSTPVDVVSTDRHTVKPWFQGKIPFAFNLPELQATEFTLVGGRMTYLGQAPGAHLIYDVRKHHISVFIFQDRSLRTGLGESPLWPTKLTFHMETWSQGGLRYFVIGDTSAADIDGLSKLFKSAS
jgi:anti-sigma factor RsiW